MKINALYCMPPIVFLSINVVLKLFGCVLSYPVAYLENQLQRKKNKKLMFSPVSLILLFNFIYIVYLD